MNKYKLKQYLNDYKAILENDAKSEENDIKDREQRINFYQSYTKEKIQKILETKAGQKISKAVIKLETKDKEAIISSNIPEIGNVEEKINITR